MMPRAWEASTGSHPQAPQVNRSNFSSLFPEMTICSLKLCSDLRGLSTALDEDSSFLMPPALREVVWGSLDILWGAARQATHCRAREQNELLFVCTQTRPARNQDNCVRGFSPICLGTQEMDLISLPQPKHC